MIVAWLEPHLEIDEVLFARRIRPELTIALQGVWRSAEVLEVGITAAELRPRFQVASADGDLRVASTGEEPARVPLRNVVAERELAQLPVGDVLIVNPRDAEIRIGAPLA